MTAIRTLRDICQDARQAPCTHCFECPGQPCQTPRPGGVHVARVARAYSGGCISGEDLAAVLRAAVVFTAETVIYGGAS